MSHKEMSRGWTIRLFAAVPKMWRGQERVTNERKKCGSCCEGHMYNNVCRGHRVDVVQIWACPLSSSLLKARQSPLHFCLKWGEFVMCAADPAPALCWVLGVTRGKARWPKNGSMRVAGWRRRAPSLPTRPPCLSKCEHWCHQRRVPLSDGGQLLSLQLPSGQMKPRSGIKHPLATIFKTFPGFFFFVSLDLASDLSWTHVCSKK